MSVATKAPMTYWRRGLWATGVLHPAGDGCQLRNLVDRGLQRRLDLEVTPGCRQRDPAHQFRLHIGDEDLTAVSHHERRATAFDRYRSSNSGIVARFQAHSRARWM